MPSSTISCSLRFDGQTYFYAAGHTRSVLLDVSTMPPLVRAALDRRLSSIGQSPATMAEALVLLLALAQKKCTQGGQMFVLGGGLMSR